jgi:hypothetical protein
MGNIAGSAKTSFDGLFKLIAKFQWMLKWCLLEFFFSRSNVDAIEYVASKFI